MIAKPALPPADRHEVATALRVLGGSIVVSLVGALVVVAGILPGPVSWIEIVEIGVLFWAAFGYGAMATGRRRSPPPVQQVAPTAAPAIVIDPRDRDQTLLYASQLLDFRDPSEVLKTAWLLIDWAAEAPDQQDFRARMDAMSRAHFNKRGPLPVQDFLGSARTYYEFISGHGE